MSGYYLIGIGFIVFVWYAITSWRHMSKWHAAKRVAFIHYDSLVLAADNAFYESLRAHARGEYEEARNQWKIYLDLQRRAEFAHRTYLRM